MIKLQRFSMAAAVALAAGAVSAVDVYRNDFSTRTSDQPLPNDRWFLYTYDPSRVLYKNYARNEEPPKACWNTNNEYQDGWAKAYMDSATMQNSPAFAVATDSDHGSADNYFALFRSSTSRSGTAIQSLHNEFTNGTIRFEIDIRRPSVWGSQGTETHAARALLVYRKYMDPVWQVGVNATAYPVMFGASWEGGTAKNRLVLHRRDESGTKTVFTPGSNAGYVCNDNWYRWRVFVDLDNQRCTCYIWDNGPSQPEGRNTADNSTATRTVENLTYFFADPMTEETGGIAGIGLNGYRFLTGTGDGLNVTNAPCFDNIYLAWKAPESSEYVPFYENDFTTRRYRQIQPTPAAAVSYPVNAGVSSVDIFSSYVTNRATAADNSNLTLLVNNDPGLIGMDNWKRLVKGNRFAVIGTETAGKNMLRASGGDGVVVQTLGETITSGKVRISGDVRLPSEWNNGTATIDARVCLALGNAVYWSGDFGSYTSRHVGYGCIAGQSKDEFCPTYLPSSGNIFTVKSADVTCTPTNWYRMVVTADLDAKTYDYELYALGPDAGVLDRTDVPPDPIYATNSIAFRNTISNIGAFSMFANKSGQDWEHYILWDNIQVWKNWDSSAGTGTLIYSNDFNNRRRYVEREKTELVHGPYTGTGVDAWEHVYRGDGMAWIAGGANRFLALKSPENANLYFTQPLPDELPCGQRVTFRADVRPPCWWLNSGGQFVNIYLGGDTMRQYAIHAITPLADSVLAFGIFANNNSTSLGRFTNSVLRVQDGTIKNVSGCVLPPDRWYRLVGSTVSGSTNWTFRAYDMGTVHPDIDTPNGTELVRLDGLARRSAPGAKSGISAIAVSAGSIGGLEPWDVYDRGKALVDNLVVTAIPGGVYLIVR